MSEVGPLLDAALRGALVATLLLVGTALARARSAQPAARVGIALMAGLVVQTFAALPPVEGGWPAAWQAPLVGVSVGNAALFWLFARALFDDEFEPGARDGAIWAAVFAIGAGFCVSLAIAGPQAPSTVALRWGLRAAPALFAALVIAAALAQWRGDLVEPRRRLRGFIVVSGTGYALVVLGTRLAAPQGRLSATAAAVDTALLLAITLVSALAVLRLADGGLLRPARRAAESPAAAPPSSAPSLPPPASRDALPDPAQERLADALERLMRGERVYRVDDLTLGVLALKLGVPEYRLRRCIHERLGHRNFSAYVNGLRLAHARAALADPTRRDASVLEIAMDAGFASIGPFNRAFKAESGTTPSDFRRRALAGS